MTELLRKHTSMSFLILCLVLPSNSHAETQKTSGHHKKKAVALAVVGGFCQAFTILGVGATIAALRFLDNKLVAVVPAALSIGFFAGAVASRVSANEQLRLAQEKHKQEHHS